MQSEALETLDNFLPGDEASGLWIASGPEEADGASGRKMFTLSLSSKVVAFLDGLPAATTMPLLSAPFLNWIGTTFGVDTSTALTRPDFSWARPEQILMHAKEAATAAKVVHALLGPEFLRDKEVLSTVMDLLQHKTSYADLVSMAVAHPIFATLAGAQGGPVDATQFVNHVYANVVGHLPSAADLAHFAQMLQSGELTQAQLAMLACEHGANQAAVGLVGILTSILDALPPPPGP